MDHLLRDDASFTALQAGPESSMSLPVLIITLSWPPREHISLTMHPVHSSDPGTGETSQPLQSTTIAPSEDEALVPLVSLFRDPMTVPMKSCSMQVSPHGSLSMGDVAVRVRPHRRGIRNHNNRSPDGVPINVEILSPVGSPDSLAAAVKGGCDAVYLAGKSFGARAFAGNFSDRQLEGAVGYAHDNGVKVHVTVNTLIKNSEMEEAVSFVRFLRDIGADAVIVQDLGLLKNLYNIDIAKHASTQMQIHSLEGLKWCSENGLDRAVLARELTMDELSRIVPESPIETEVFIQGALCYCMSGGCMLSSFIGGRSGNRGSCAQPCRKRYERDGKAGYLMSSADIYGIDYIGKLRDIGVTSLKIEGRMRSPAYTYLASKAYSMAEDGIDGEEYDETLELLRTVFNRGTCHGYFDGVKSPVQSLYPDNRGFFIADVRIEDKTIVTEFDEPVGLKDGLSIFDGDRKVGGFKVMDLHPIHVPFKIPDGDYQIYRTYDPRIDVIKNEIGNTPKLNGDTQRTPVKLKFEKTKMVIVVIISQPKIVVFLLRK